MSWEQLDYESKNIYNLHYGLIHKGLPTQIDLNKSTLPGIISEFEPKNYRLCKDGDVSFADASEDTNDVAKVVEFHNCRNKKIVCGLHTIHGRDKLRITVIGFKGYSFSSNVFRDQIRKLAQGTKVFSISQKNFNECYIGIPSKEEQIKIATFLSLIDERITTQRKTIEGLEKMVEELSKQIFLQKIGFDCSIWQKISLDKIGFTYSGLSGKTKEDFGSGKPYIQYKQVYESSKIDLSKCDFVSINKNEKQNRVQYGDILFTTSSETPEEVGMTSVVLDKVEDTYLNSFCFGFRLNSFDILNPNFARFLLRSNDFRKRIAKLGQGSTRFNISKNQLMKEKILLPPLATQHKIANFLSYIDRKIETEKEILTQYQKQKKYLLQNLFI